MTHLQEADLPSLPVTQVREQVGDITRLAERGASFPPEIAQAFTEVLLNGSHKRTKRWNVALIAGTILGPAGIGALIDTYADNLPSLGHAPPLVDNFLRRIENTFPWRTEPSSIPPELIWQIPELSFGVLAAATAAFTAPQVREWFGRRRVRDRAIVAQAQISQAMAEGTMRWNLTPASPDDPLTRVAFVGDGNFLATSIAEAQHVRQLQIAYNRPAEGYWTHLPREVTQINRVNEILELADLENAGEAFFYSTDQMHTFLPSPEDYVISNDRIVFYIRRLDKFCQAYDDNTPRLVVVVGSKTQGMGYATIDGQQQRNLSEVSLEERLDALRQERGGDVNDQPNIVIIDPTEIIMKEICRLAAGREILFHGTTESVEKYHVEFYKRLRRTGYEITRGGKVRVVYNLNDLPTVTETDYDDIAVLADPAQEAEMQSRGMDAERILVVRDEVLELTKPLMV